MSNGILSIKESKKLRLCGYCLAKKGRSKKFPTPYSLTWHITHYHKDDIGIVTPVKVSQPQPNREITN